MNGFEPESQRSAMQRYIRDMAVGLALSTHKDDLDREPDPRTFRRMVHEVAQLAAHIALEKYDAENRTIVAQAESFGRLAAERNATRIPMHILQMASVTSGLRPADTLRTALPKGETK